MLNREFHRMEGQLISERDLASQVEEKNICKIRELKDQYRYQEELRSNYGLRKNYRMNSEAPQIQSFEKAVKLRFRLIQAIWKQESTVEWLEYSYLIETFR